MPSIVARRIAALEHTHHQPSKGSPDDSVEGGEASTTTETYGSSSSVSTESKSGGLREVQESDVHIGNDRSEEEGVQAVFNPEATDVAQELLFGTFVAFAERVDHISVNTSISSQPNVRDGEEDGYEAEAEITGTCSEECSEDALMAAIAVATTKKGEETNYSDFFANAAAEAVTAAEQMVEECLSDREETQEEKDMREEMFQKIEEQLSNTERHGAGVKAGKSTSVADVLEDLERLFLFTDVVDQNPPPSSDSTALVSSDSKFSGGTDPWWEVYMQEVGKCIYKSSVDVYNEVERTRKEVERTLLFTDVPDDTNGTPLSPKTAVKTDDSALTKTVRSAEIDHDLAAYSSDTSGTVAASHRLEGNNKISPQAQVPGSKGAPKKPNGLRASHVAPQPELNRVFKSLEKNLLFTDLPDEPFLISKNRAPTVSKTLSSTTALSSRSAGSTFGMCRMEMERTLCFTDLEDAVPQNRPEKNSAKSHLMSQVLADNQCSGSSLQQQLLTRMEEARALQQRQLPDRKIGAVQSVSGPKTENAVGAEPEERSIDDESSVVREQEDGLYYSTEVNSVIATPGERDLLSDVSSSNDKASIEESMGESALESIGSRNEGSSSSERENEDVSSLNVVLSDDTPNEAKEQETLASDAITEIMPYPGIKADSSTEKSVRLLVEVHVNKSRSYSTSSGAFIQNEISRSEASASTPYNERDDESYTQDNKSDAGESCDEEQARACTSQDQQNLNIMIGEDSQEDAESDLAGFLASVDDDERPESSKEDEIENAWEDCASSIADDTYATAEDNQNEAASLHTSHEFREDCRDPKDQDVSRTKATKKDERPEGSDEDGFRTLEPLFASVRDTIECPNDDFPAIEALFASADEDNSLPTTEMFDALLAEMKDLETAINFDLKKAHTVLRKTTQRTGG